MTIAVMQPYIFPYLGYYQLVNSVDTFVFFDDVNFINKGWINRNRILLNNEAFRFTIPLVKASQNKLINEIEVAEFGKWRLEFLKILENSYKKAPCFEFFYDWITNFLNTKVYSSISELTTESIKSVSTLLGISTQFIKSSDLDYKSSDFQTGQDKIIRICKMLKADHYINPNNGMEIYENEKFNSQNIVLDFIRMNEVVYNQFKKSSFVPSLSIIDILMFVNVEEAKMLLGQYMLVKKISTDAIT
jgi:hypothetical protein